MTSTHETDVVIIGAGPVGLFAIFECGMMNMRCHVVDALDMTGGQCTALYPEKPIYDIAGFPSIDAADLIHNLEQQAASFDPVYHLGQQVTQVEQQGNIWHIRTSKDITIQAHAIIIAAGCGAFGPNRPPLKELEAYEATGSVAYMVQKKEDYRDKRLVIAGGGDSAVDWILSLADIASHISVVHRRPKFRCAPDNEAKVKKLAEDGVIDLVIPYQLAELKGSDGNLEQVIVKDLDSNTRALDADVLLPFYGLAMELGPIADWGLNIHMKHIEVDHSTCETNQSGIYAIGDIATYKNKLKLIVCGFSEAAMAAHAIYPRVHKEAYHFEYSTTKGVPHG